MRPVTTFIFFSFFSLMLWGQNIDSMIDDAIAFQQEGKLDQSIKVMEQALEKLEERDSTYRWFGLIQCNKAYFQYIKPDFEKAIQSYKKGIEFYHRDSVYHLETYFNAHFNIGGAYSSLFFQNQQDTSLRDSADLYFLYAFNLKEEIFPPEDPRHVEFWKIVGDVVFDRGDYELASRSYRNAYQHLLQYYPDSTEMIIKATNLIGQSFQNLEKADSALYYYRICLEKSRSLTTIDSSEIAKATYNVAAMLHRLHDFEQSLEYLDIAVAARKELFPVYIKKEFLIRAAGYYFETDQLNSAELFYLRTLNEDIGDAVEGIEMDAPAMLQLFVTYVKMGRMMEGISMLERACSFYQEHFKDEALTLESCRYAEQLRLLSSNPEMAQKVLDNLKTGELGDFSDETINTIAHQMGADTTLMEYEMPADDSRYNAYLANKLSVLATNNFLSNNFSLALENIQEAFGYLVPAFTKTNDLYTEPNPEDFTFNFGLLSTFFLLKSGIIFTQISQEELVSDEEWGYAEALFEKTDRVLQRLRRMGRQVSLTPIGESLQVEFYFNMSQLYRMRFNATQRSEYIEQAFQALEKRKAANLLEGLKIKSLRLNNPVFAKLKSEEQQFINRINLIAAQIADEYAEKGMVSFDQKKLDSLETRYNQEHQEFSEFYSEIKLKYPDYYELQEPPANVTVNKASQLLDEQTVIINYYLVNDLLTTVILAKEDGMRAFVTKKVPELQQYIKSVKSVLDAPGKVNESYRNDAFKLYQILFPIQLQSVKNLIIVPDGALYEVPFGALLTQDSSPDTPLKEFPFLTQKHNISYGASANLVLQNLESQQMQKNFSENLVAAFGPESNTYLHPNWFQNALEDDSFQTGIKVFTEGNATKSNFLNVTKSPFRIIHLDAHGKERENANLSFIQFYDFEELYLPEIMDHNLQNDLFVLSSCDLGSGKILAAEGLIGFIRGLQFAGTKNVITSKNSVSILASKTLYTEFYRQVFLHKESYGAALQKAKKYLIEHGNQRYADPFYWGGLMLFGH